MHQLRTEEYEKYEVGEFTAYTNTRLDAIVEGYISITRTIFICILLSVGALFFSRDAEILVLNPIERMIEKVKIIAKNPLAAASGEIETAGFLSMTEKEKKKKDKKKGKKKKDAMETDILEETIIKISYLLALGFGEAGGKIIASNIAKGGDLDPMMAGEKVVAIFGFCDIHHFAEANEVLDIEIMMFVNQIADIVHFVVDKFGGQANKNIGEAFLMVWKFQPEDVKKKGKSVKLRRWSKNKSIVADLALFGFLKVVAKISKTDKILDYSRNEVLLGVVPNFKVRMGFGLHVGWAIEGAIGSEFKIDASYLSPNVNLAARLEAASR